MSNRQPPDESPASTSPTIDEKGQSNLLASAALSASASSLASVASSKASVATTKSGIRPPSKIGRLCGDKHKPPVPASPPKSNELDDPLKKMIDEFGRHRLTDVLEEECEEEQSGRTSWNGSVNRKRYSSSSPASSMDALCWELHARRLSEAGLSRHSDSSTILTEDTDSFIIGQRVWVGGNKPGHIAFIGETQFAPGEWAGIALDEPIGKNDGSVSGIRYFMCEPKKGVFSRLTRLTRVPLDHGGSGDTFTFSTPPPSNNSVRKSPMSPSPTESHRSIMKSPVSAHGSNTSLSSAHVDYKIGDRVIIKSGQGSKVGTVKFMGVTEFAPGEWVGVELDEPRGKNDGSVNGIRYFECQPNFGLFSPISKVSKSPSKIKPNQCQIHSPIGGGLPPSGLKRANSKESMTSNLSMMSSASTAARGVRLGVTSLAPKKVPTKLSATPVPTRTALQDVLKEKQQHIEQLLKERDLERAEITRAASQADEAEQKLSVLTQEYTKYRAECESQLQTHIELLNKLKESRQELVTQLEDEKKKNEDWQFRFEEAEITRADLEVSNEANLSKIKELEASLASEKEKVENLEADVNKLFETEENLIKTKEEVENLKKELQETKNKHVMLKGDTATTTVLIKSLQDDLDQSIKDCDEKSVMIDVLKKEISNFQMEQASFKKQLELAANQIAEITEKSTLKDKNIELLKSELDNVNKIASEKSKTVEQLQAENLIIGDEFVEKLAKKDEELIKYQASNEDNSKTIEKLNKEIENIKIEAETKNNELCELHKKTVAELNQAVVNLSTQNEKLQKDLETQIKEKNKIIEELNKKLSESNEKIEQLQKDLENSKTTSKQSFAELEIKYQKDIDSQKTKINELSTELNHKINYSSKLNEELSTLRASLENKTKEYENLNSEHEKIKTKLEEDLESKSEELKKAIDAINNNSNIIHSLQTELQTTKLDLETASKDLLQYQTNLSDVEAKLKKERDELHESLKIKLTEFDNLKKELADTIIAKDKSLAELSGEVTEKLEIINKLNNDLIRQKEESKKIINELVEKHKKVLEENALNISQNNTEIVKKHEEINQLNINISKLESSFMDKNAEFDKLKSEMHNILEENKAYSERVKNLSNEVETLNISNANLESKCKEMEEFKLQLEKIKNELEIQLNAKNNDLTESIENLTKKDSQISQLISELNSAKVETEKLSQELLLYQSNLSNVENNLKQERDDIKLELNKTVDELSTLKEKLNIKYVETENLIQENNSIKLELLEKHKEFDKVKDELMLLNNNLEENLSNEDILKQQLNEAKSELSSKSAELQAVKNDLSRISKDLEEKLSEAHNLLAEKTKQIHEKQDEITQMNENQKKFTNDLMEDHKTKLQENDTKLKNWQNDMKIKIEEINKLNENINNLKMLVSTKDDQMEKLNKELTELKSSNKESAETNKAIETLEKDNQIYKNKLETLENELAKIKSEKELLDLKIQQTTSNTSSRLSELEKKLIEKDEIIESLKLGTEKSKSDSEKLIKEQTEKIKAVEYSENLLKNMIAETEAKQANTLKTNVNSLQGEINKRDITIASKDNEISKLKDQLSKVQTTTTALNRGTSDNVAKSNGTTDYQQLLEEKIFAENQVAFLNSIIVDMQKKNEEQQMRIEILEKGYSPAAAEELHQLGFNVSERQVAPRMYCDICEEFDLHETEDCPTQASDEPASNVQLGKEKKGKPPPRPYCNICEEFGHDTADCTDDQEF